MTFLLDNHDSFIKEDKAYIHVGGGIVADSKPLDEDQETLHKAKALFRVLRGQLHEFQ